MSNFHSFVYFEHQAQKEKVEITTLNYAIF